MKISSFVLSCLSLLVVSSSVASEPRATPSGIAASDWASVKAAHDAWRHGFQKTATGYEAVNPGQQWRTQFDGLGFTAQPKDGGWQWGLELKRYGFAGAECAMCTTPIAQAAGQSLAYQWGATLEEWFVNDRRGLEHGFTVKQRPSSASASELAFTLGVRGGLKPVITSDALGVEFQNDAGITVLTYAGLKVWDADGKVLRSRFEPASEGVRLLVDECGARYPITIDPIAQQAYVKASNPDVDDQFGISVAISGDTMVIGAPHEDSSTTTVNSVPNNLAPDAGAAYVFVRSGGVWVQEAYLKAANAGSSDAFGMSVAIDGNTIVVGATGEDGSGNQVNPAVDELAPEAGAAYVFTRSAGVWSQQAYLKASASGDGDLFGGAVAIDGDRIVVGATHEDGSGTGVNPPFNNGASDAGAAYVFVRTGLVGGGTWSSEAYLKASNTAAGALFGWSVAISGDSVIVGAPLANTFEGAAHVYVRGLQNWSHQALFEPEPGDPTDSNLGLSVAISGDRAVVGMPCAFRFPPSTSETGRVAVYSRAGAVWSRDLSLMMAQPGDHFGASLALEGDVMIVGAPNENGGGNGVNPPANSLASSSGAAYVLVWTGRAWTIDAYLKAPNAEAGDYFGSSVGVSGTSVVIGAPYESGNGTGVNPASNNVSALAGASYVFTGIGEFPDMGVEQPAGSSVANGGVRNFGPVATGSHASMTFTIKNTGPDVLNLVGQPLVLLLGQDAPMFSVTSAPATSLAALTGSTTFTVEFSPTAAGPRHVSLLIFSDDVRIGPFTIHLNGTTPDPEIGVEQGGSAIASGDTKSFGDVGIGNEASLTFQIVNEGGSDILLTNVPKVVVNGPDASMFTVTAQPASPLIPGAVTSFTVRFAPTSLGTKHAQLTIPNNDSNEGNYQIILSGTVVPADIAVERPTGTSLSDGSIDNLGAVPVGSSTDFTFTVRNVGGQMLGLNGSPRVNLTGVDAAMFTIMNAPSATIAPGASSTFVVRFAPTSDGPKTAALSIPSTDADESPFDITLNATVLGFNHDTDGDGLNDASELQMAAFGFNWQVSQTDMVQLYYSSANGAGLYSQAQYDARYIAGQNSVLNNPNAFSLYTSTQYDQNRADGMNLIFNDPNSYGLYTSVQWLAARTLGQLDVMNAPNNYALFTPAQVADSRTAGRNDVTSDPNAYNLFTQSQLQALNVGSPLLAKNPTTGEFTLTLGVQKSSDLTTFTALPMTAPQCTINSQGRLEFKFTSPGNAAFFKVQAQ